MRFKRKQKTTGKFVKKWFAILPVWIKDECRWLEVVRVRGFYDDKGKFNRLEFK